MSKPNHLFLSVTFLVVAILLLMGLALANTAWAGSPTQGTVPPPGKTPTDPGRSDPCINTPISITTNAIWNLPPTSIQDAFIAGCTKVIVIKEGTIPTGTNIQVKGVGQPPCPPTPEDMLFLGHCFQVDWNVKEFKATIIDCLPYSADDLKEAGGNPNNLLIGFYVDGKWVMVKPTTVTGTYVCAEFDKPFTFQALFTVKPKIPTTGEALPSTRWELWAIALGFALVFLGGARYALKRM